MRVSAEAKTQQKAKELVSDYSKKISEIAGSLEHDAFSWGANETVDKFT